MNGEPVQNQLTVVADTARHPVADLCSESYERLTHDCVEQCVQDVNASPVQ